MKVTEIYFSNRTDLFSVGIANIKSVPGDLEANQKRITAALKVFSKRKVNLAVFPEYCISGFLQQPKAIEKDCIDQIEDWLNSVSRTFLNDTLEYIVLNGFEKADKAPHKYYNTTFVLKQNQPFLQRNRTYRKTFITSEEKPHVVSGGSDTLIVNTHWGKFGFLTCYDICFPHLFYPLSRVERVDGIIVTAAWRKQGKRDYTGLEISDDCIYQRQWDILMQAMAAQNQSWVMAANAVGPHAIQDLNYCGNSGIWAPSGMNLMKASSREETLLILHNIDIVQEAKAERKDYNYAKEVIDFYNPAT